MEYTIDEYENAELDEKADDIQCNDSDSSVLTVYLKEISKYPVLSREQETALFKRLSEGDEDAREALINTNLKLVVSIIKKLHSHSVRYGYDGYYSGRKYGAHKSYRRIRLHARE